MKGPFLLAVLVVFASLPFRAQGACSGTVLYLQDGQTNTFAGPLTAAIRVPPCQYRLTVRFDGQMPCYYPPTGSTCDTNQFISRPFVAAKFGDCKTKLVGIDHDYDYRSMSGVHALTIDNPQAGDWYFAVADDIPNVQIVQYRITATYGGPPGSLHGAGLFTTTRGPTGAFGAHVGEVADTVIRLLNLDDFGDSLTFTRVVQKVHRTSGDEVSANLLAAPITLAKSGDVATLTNHFQVVANDTGTVLTSGIEVSEFHSQFVPTPCIRHFGFKVQQTCKAGKPSQTYSLVRRLSIFPTHFLVLQRHSIA